MNESLQFCCLYPQPHSFSGKNWTTTEVRTITNCFASAQLFYHHNTTVQHRHHCRLHINLSVSTIFPLLMNKTQWYLNAFTWGNKFLTQNEQSFKELRTKPNHIIDGLLNSPLWTPTPEFLPLPEPCSAWSARNYWLSHEFGPFSETPIVLSFNIWVCHTCPV